MNGIWIRSEDGTMLMLAKELLVGSDDGVTWWLYVGVHQVGVYKTYQQAMRQLDDIQIWITDPIRIVKGEAVYDLRERKVKEDE